MLNPLRDSGKPLFFQVESTSGPVLPAPASRHGQTVRLLARSLSDMQKEGLAFNTRSGSTWRLASDEGAYLAGLDEAPCPLSFLTTGMVCSYLEEILALARKRGLDPGRITLVQDNYYTMRGSALRGTMTGGARNIELELKLESASGDDAQWQSLVQDAVSASPLNGLMRGEKPSFFSLTHNGKVITPAKAKALANPEPPSADDIFDQSVPKSGDWSGLILRNGMSPETEETVTRGGDSLREEQDRVLHVRGICRLREDGVKQVEQQLFNPHGSIFHFLCEEGAANGGKGRAPDAASYIAAGIGFCFMTQLGRYAKILKKGLLEYRIVQDIHFSLGGASAGTGQAGLADPVETHVYLTSGEDDDFARAMLDMGEQTCFLHAFCRTDLKARVKITRL